MNRIHLSLAIAILCMGGLRAAETDPAAVTETDPAVRVETDAGAAEGANTAAAAAEPVVETELVFPQPRIATVSARALNVRVAPDTSRELITTLKQGRQIKVISRKGKWLKIELPEDITTWIMGKFVALPEAATLPATGVVNADRVRLRSGGDFKAPILKELSEGTQLEIVERNADWLRVKTPPAVFAWVHGNYITFGDAAANNGGNGDNTTTGPVPGTEEGTATANGAGSEDQPNPAVVKGPGVDIFAEAEAAYEKAKAEPQPDLVPVFLLYRKVTLVEGVPSVVKNTCEARMAEIAAKLPAAQKKRIDSEVKRKVEEQIAALKAAAEAAKRQLPKVAPRYTAVGYVDRAPAIAGIPGSYKLSMSGVLLYYLNPTGDGVDLEKLIGHKVGVVGRKRFVEGWGVQVVDVISARDYQEPPKTTSRLEIIED